MNSTWRRLLVLAFVAAAATHDVSSQTPKPRVTVTRANGTTVSLSEADLRVWSSSGYAFGGSFQTYFRLLITDPVVPPEGVKLTPRTVEWNAVQKVEWTPGPDDRKGDQRIEKVTYRDGRTESVFIWRPMSGDSHARFYSCQLQVRGKLSLGGKDQDVEIGESEAAARACTRTPIVSLEFVL